MTATQEKTKIVFAPPPKEDFYSTVRTRVDAYFKGKNISRNANVPMIVKTFTLLALYFGLYFAILSDQFTGGLLLALFASLGFIKALMGFNISHDAMHGSYFSNPRYNYYLSYLFDFNGMSSYVWKTTHNVQHHTYTNIQGHDGDIDKAVILKLCPHDKHYPFHRFQAFYAPLLYMLTSVNWLFWGDYACFYALLKKGVVPRKEVILFFTLKVLNLITFLILPFVFLSAPWTTILLGYFLMHVVGGFTSAIVFQLAHVVEGVEFPLTTQDGKILEPWGAHEMHTTGNFAKNSALCTSLFGGLNFQIEHHLFPHVCHIHYPNIAPIVRKTAEEYSLPYHEIPGFFEAVASHLKTLHRFGKG